MTASPPASPDQDRFDRELCSYLAGFLTPQRRRRLLSRLVERTRHLTVVLEDIHSPHNASACLRSCDCFGLQDVHVIQDFNPFDLCHDIAIGSAQWLTLHRYGKPPAGAPVARKPPDATGVAECLAVLERRGYSIVVTSPHQADCDLEELDIARPTALVFGNEKAGVSPDLLARADHVLRIPMFGFTESFNISVAVAICLHHLVWKLRQLPLDWRLTEDEQRCLLLDWVRAASGHRLARLEERFRETWNPAGPPVPREQLWPQTEEKTEEGRRKGEELSVEGHRPLTAES